MPFTHYDADTPLEEIRMRPHFLRSREIHKLRSKLEQHGYPRLQMALLVSITGASGFIASYVLLSNGLLTMWLRYLLAFGIAYLVFLGLLWLWLRTSASAYDGIESAIPVPDSIATPGTSHSAFSGQGGNFDGGGASGNFDSSLTASSLDNSDNTIFKDAAGVAGDADELAIPIFALLFLAGLILSSLWVIYMAPLLFAELLLDGVLAASLYKRLRGLEPRHWLETALRRTALPFGITAIVLVCAGLGLQHYAPDAHTLSQALSAVGITR